MSDKSMPKEFSRSWNCQIAMRKARIKNSELSLKGLFIELVNEGKL
jgi:hypothetical protein